MINNLLGGYIRDISTVCWTIYRDSGYLWCDGESTGIYIFGEMGTVDIGTIYRGIKDKYHGML